MKVLKQKVEAEQKLINARAATMINTCSTEDMCIMKKMQGVFSK